MKTANVKTDFESSATKPLSNTSSSKACNPKPLTPIAAPSGAWTPPEAMPAGMREAMFLSPLYYFIEMGYGILLKGAGLNVLWDSLLGLALLGIVIFGFGVWRFKHQFG